MGAEKEQRDTECIPILVFWEFCFVCICVKPSVFQQTYAVQPLHIPSQILHGMDKWNFPAYTLCIIGNCTLLYTHIHIWTCTHNRQTWTKFGIIQHIINTHKVPYSYLSLTLTLSLISIRLTCTTQSTHTKCMSLQQKPVINSITTNSIEGK